MSNDFDQVGLAYRAGGGNNPKKENGSKQRSVFFFKLHLNNNTKQIFTRLGFNTGSLPVVLYSQPFMASATEEAL